MKKQSKIAFSLVERILCFFVPKKRKHLVASKKAKHPFASSVLLLRQRSEAFSFFFKKKAEGDRCFCFFVLPRFSSSISFYEGVKRKKQKEERKKQLGGLKTSQSLFWKKNGDALAFLEQKSKSIRFTPSALRMFFFRALSILLLSAKGAKPFLPRPKVKAFLLRSLPKFLRVFLSPILSLFSRGEKA